MTAPTHPLATDDHLDHATWRALGTGVRLVVLDGDLDPARAAVEQVLADVDRAYSRFRPDSELMVVNAAGGRRTRIGPLLARAIQGAIEAASRTGGAVDPTVGRALRVIGYDAGFDLIAATSRPLELRVAPVPGWSTVDLDARAGAVRLPASVELDLGSTGKGLAADLAAGAALAVARGRRGGEPVRESDHEGVRGSGQEAVREPGILVSLGGDIATAGRAPRGGWRVLTADDSDTPVEEVGEVIAIEAGAVATSSTTVRRWRSDRGTTVHHIVDPRTGLPAQTPWRTVTVVADTCEHANAASTAAMVMGKAAAAWLSDQRLPSRLVAEDGRIERVGGWPQPGQGPATGETDAP